VIASYSLFHEDLTHLVSSLNIGLMKMVWCDNGFGVYGSNSDLCDLYSSGNTLLDLYRIVRVCVNI
jgi:hypothetical protein